MPEFAVDMNQVQHVHIQGIGARPFVKLPKTNLERVEPPPNMTYNQIFLWELAMLLEGICGLLRAVTYLGS